MTSYAHGHTAPCIQYLGPLPDDLEDVLTAVYEGGLAQAGDFTRSHITTINLLASLGFITTISPNLLDYSGRWLITVEGLIFLKELTR